MAEAGAAAVVLAAGAGARFEGTAHKLLAPLDGLPVVTHAVGAAIEAQLAATYVVTGAVDLGDAVPGGAIVVDNPDWGDGLAASLAVGLTAAGADGWTAAVVGLGDMPFVPPSAWRAVASADGDLVTAAYSGRRSPPVKIVADLWPLLPTTGDDGARQLMRDRPDLVREVACEGRPADIDTTSDLDRWS